LRCFVASMVAAVFVSLNEEDTTKSNQLKAADIVVERIVNAKTVNGILSISKMNVVVSLKDDALKVRA
jgi:hypothetical protein